MHDQKLSIIYYSLRGHWKGNAAIKKLAETVKVNEDVARVWLMKQAIWQIYLPTPLYIPKPKFDVSTLNDVHQADLLFLPHNKVGRKTFKFAFTMVDVPSW